MGKEGSPPNSPKIYSFHPPGKIPQVDYPHQIFIPLPPIVNFPHSMTILLATVTDPVLFAF